MGTPHAGSDKAALAHALVGMGKLFQQANKDIVTVLKRDSGTLAGIQEDFHCLLKFRHEARTPIQVFCFFEELDSSIKVGKVS